jgi:hypothetical protein
MFAGATLLLYLAAPGAFAAPITHTLSGPVSGTLGATPFTNAQITIVATGDTSTVDCGAPIFCNTLSSVTFTINGVGSGTVTDGLSIFDATVGTLGLERTTGGLVDWIDHDAIEFQTFNLATSLGPITVAPRTPQVAVATTAGSLNLTSGPTTFQSVRDWGRRRPDGDDYGGNFLRQPLCRWSIGNLHGNRDRKQPDRHSPIQGWGYRSWLAGDVERWISGADHRRIDAGNAFDHSSFQWRHQQCHEHFVRCSSDRQCFGRATAPDEPNRFRRFPSGG